MAVRLVGLALRPIRRMTDAGFSQNQLAAASKGWVS